MIPPGYASKSTAEKELVDFVIQYQAGSQAWALADAGKIVQGAIGDTGNPQVDEQLVKWKGPYATQADAKAAANPRQQNPNPLNDAGNAIENSSDNPLAAVGDIIRFLTQKNIWLRGAEITAGLMLVYLGLRSSMSGTAAGNVTKQAGHIASIPVRHAIKGVKTAKKASK